MIPPEFIDEVLSRVDIVEIVEPRVALKKTGQNYTGLCPFHQEKSPSFSVSQDKQFYYCFGCQASGSALKFLMEFERMEFIQAVETLAARVGLEVPNDRRPEATEATRKRKTIYEILDQAANHYQEALRSHASKSRAVDYLQNRGLSGQIAKEFGLGYAPPGWSNLYDKLASSNFNRDLLIESGMVIENKEEDKTYDRFRDRIMFPIRDLRGRTIAFGGRVLGDGKPKYLNSPETPVFHKGRELYGLYEARKRNSKLSRILVVEGYMDVVALAQYGIGYSVATLGTATSADHIERIYRLVPQIVFCFDGDTAGKNAGWKALLTVLEAMVDGRSAKFLFVPDGEDPDSLIRAEGKDRFELRLEQASSLDEFFFSHLEASVDMQSIDGKAALSKTAMPLINLIPQGVFKQLMIDALSARTGLETNRLLEVAAQTKPASRAAYMPSEESTDGTVAAQRPQKERGRMNQPANLAEIALSMLVQQPELAQEFEDSDYEKLLQVAEFSQLAEIALVIRREELLSPGNLLHHFQGQGQFSVVRELINREQLLDVAALRAEYKGTITNLLTRFETQLKQALITDLLSKPLSDLSAEERQLIKDNYRRKKQ